MFRLISTSWFTSVKKGTVTLVNSNADNPDYIPVSPGLTALVRIIVKNYSPLYSKKMDIARRGEGGWS